MVSTSKYKNHENHESINNSNNLLNMKDDYKNLFYSKASTT